MEWGGGVGASCRFIVDKPQEILSMSCLSCRMRQIQRFKGYRPYGTVRWIWLPLRSISTGQREIWFPFQILAIKPFRFGLVLFGTISNQSLCKHCKSYPPPHHHHPHHTHKHPISFRHECKNEVFDWKTLFIFLHTFSCLAIINKGSTVVDWWCPSSATWH